MSVVGTEHIQDTSKINIIYTNADCLTNKLDEFRLILSNLKFKPTVIIVTEVNAKISSCPMQSSEFNIDGYCLHSLNIGLKEYRGIIIYVDSNY